MFFENFAIQHRKLSPNLNYLSPIMLPEFSYSKINRTRKDSKHLSTGRMVVNNKGKIVSFNHKFILIWKLPQHIVKARCESQVLQIIAEQLENPIDFLVNIGKIHKQVDTEIQTQVKLKDGRAFSHLIKLQWSDRKVVGRVCQFNPLMSSNSHYENDYH